jgi:hypothetical protein
MSLILKADSNNIILSIAIAIFSTWFSFGTFLNISHPIKFVFITLPIFSGLGVLETLYGRFEINESEVHFRSLYQK